MKNTSQILDLKSRHESEPRPARHARSFPHPEHYYQTCKLSGGCGEPVEFQGSSFFKLSNDYFADEAPRSFAVDAVVFWVLILTAILPIVNSVQAVAALIHYVGVL